MKLKPSHKCRKGSLLLEALLSVVILSISLTLIVGSFLTSLRAIDYSVDLSKALFLIDQKMFDYMKDRFIEAGITETEEIRDKDRVYKYQLQTESTDTRINRVLFDVQWQSGRRRNSMSIETFLFAPPEQ